jgi:hypothetical protein
MDFAIKQYWHGGNVTDEQRTMNEHEQNNVAHTHVLIGVEKCPNDGYCSDKRRLSLFCVCVFFLDEEEEEGNMSLSIGLS